jgi:cyclopropane fatty-acyl-phospholipid synthase-like methyltransferase
LGEGEGRNAVFLAMKGLVLTALDASDIGLAKAGELARQKGVKLSTVTADLAAYDPGRDAWDGIVSIWCHLPSQLRRDFYPKVVAALKPGGIFLLESYTPKQLEFGTGGPPDPDFLANADTLKSELKGLEWLYAGEKTREVREGRYHNGMSVVVQLIGRKPG